MNTQPPSVANSGALQPPPAGSYLGMVNQFVEAATLHAHNAARFVRQYALAASERGPVCAELNDLTHFMGNFERWMAQNGAQLQVSTPAVAPQTFTIQAVPSDEVAALWPEIAHWRESSGAHGGWVLELENTQHNVANQTMRLWVVRATGVLKGVCLTEIVQFPNAKVLFVIVAGGTDMNEWIPTLADELDRYAVEQGCTTVDAYCGAAVRYVG